MLGNREKFLRILRIELEDLRDHIENLVAEYAERQRRNEVTEHVGLSNIAVLKNEECAVKHFMRVVDNTRPEDFENLDALIAMLRSRFDREINRTGLSHAACVFTERKMQRIEHYVRHDQWKA